VPRYGSSRRPSRAALEQAIREAEGNITRLAGRVGASRQTLYKWIYELDLAGVAGIRKRGHPQEATALRVSSLEEDGRS
jgi:transposase-like protein